jgi:hypothetical protein
VRYQERTAAIIGEGGVLWRKVAAKLQNHSGLPLQE